jgi:hypothetical protein
LIASRCLRASTVFGLRPASDFEPIIFSPRNLSRRNAFLPDHAIRPGLNGPNPTARYGISGMLGTRILRQGSRWRRPGSTILRRRNRGKWEYRTEPGGEETEPTAPTERQRCLSCAWAVANVTSSRQCSCNIKPSSDSRMPGTTMSHKENQRALDVDNDADKGSPKTSRLYAVWVAVHFGVTTIVSLFPVGEDLAKFALGPVRNQSIWTPVANY